MNCFGVLGEEENTLREPMLTQGKLHTDRPSREPNQVPSHCEATVLTITPTSVHPPHSHIISLHQTNFGWEKFSFKNKNVFQVFTCSQKTWGWCSVNYEIIVVFSLAKTNHTEKGNTQGFNSNRLNITCQSTLNVAIKTKCLKTNERKGEGLLTGDNNGSRQH